MGAWRRASRNGVEGNRRERATKRRAAAGFRGLGVIARSAMRAVSVHRGGVVAMRMGEVQASRDGRRHRGMTKRPRRKSEAQKHP